MEFSITVSEVIEELRFVLELIVGELLFAFTCCKKKPNFSIRLTGGIVFMSIYSMTYFLIKYLFVYLHLLPDIYIPVIIIAHYIFETTLTTVLLLFCFDFSIDQALFHTIGGYSIQHLSFVLFHELIARTWFPILSERLLLYTFVSVTGFALICISLYLLFIRRFKDISYVYFFNQKRSLSYFLIILIVTIFLTFTGQSVYQNNTTTRVVANPNYLGAAVSILTCFLILSLINMLYMDNQKSRERDLINQLMYEQKKQFEYKKESVESFRRLAHDMKHRLLAVEKENGKRTEELEKMRDEIEAYDNIINTNNETLNILLSDKIISTRKEGIRIEYEGDASLISFMDTVDLYVFLGNALDNAIEAIGRAGIKEKSIILSIKHLNGITSIYVSNYFDGELNVVDGTIKTHKKDEELHGIGLKSMKRIVEKYSGTLSFEKKDNIFTLKAIFVKS